MRTVSLTRVVTGHDDTTIKIDPSHGFAVGAYFTDDGVALDLCMVLTAFGSFRVRGTVEEVSAALESATAPPVAAAVEVATDHGDSNKEIESLRHEQRLSNSYVNDISEALRKIVPDASGFCEALVLADLAVEAFGKVTAERDALAAKLRGGG